MAGGMYGRAACMARVCVWQGGMCGRGCGIGVHGGGMHGRGRARQERRPLQLTVRILLECILVINSSNQSDSVAEHLCDMETSGETFREM